MRLDFFATYWGQKHIPIPEFLAKAKEAGYRGIETPIPDARQQQALVAQLLENSGMELIAQVVMCKDPNFERYRTGYLDEVEALAELNPRMINCHTGRDYFTREQNIELIGAANEIAGRYGIPIVHETHRGRFSYNPWTIEDYLEALPGLTLTADFSHWCVVTESLMENHGDLMQRVTPRCGYIHARIGHANGPQVVNPEHPNWALELETHIQWWQQIIDSQPEREAIAITPEFGPPTYMPTHPQTGEPIEDQWAVNLAVKKLLQERLKTDA